MDAALRRLKEIMGAGTAEPLPKSELTVEDRLLLQNGTGPQVACVHRTFESDGNVLGFDWYLPDAEYYDDARPGVLFFFGGGFKFGCKEAFRPQAMEFARAGYVVGCAAYRTWVDDHSATPATCIADGVAAWHYFRASAGEWNMDDTRLAAGGGSAGGLIALMVGPVSGTYPQALALWNPGLADERVPAIKEVLGMKVGGVPVFGIDSLEPGMPPMIVMHGEDDQIVPVACARELAERAEEVGVPCRLIVYPGERHGFFNYFRNRPNYLITTGEAMRFLDEQLGA